MYTPYTRDNFFVRAHFSDMVKTWAAEHLYDFMDENEEDAFLEYKESGEDMEGVEFYDSGTYQRYRDGSDWEICQFDTEEDILDWILEVEKPIITLFKYGEE